MLLQRKLRGLRYISSSWRRSETELSFVVRDPSSGPLRYTWCSLFNPVCCILLNPSSDLIPTSTSNQSKLGSQLAPPLLLAGVFVMCTLTTDKLYAQNFEGQSFALGETKLIPELRLDYVSTDNAFRDAEDTVDATGFVVSPALQWQADRRLLELSATYRGAYGVFSESELDFTDHDLRARVEAAPGIRHRTSAEFRVLQEAEELGTGQTAFVFDADELVVETNTTLDLAYAFGAREARGNIGGGLRLGDRSFNTVGDVTDGDDFTLAGPFGFFSYRLSPDTRLRAEIRFATLDFDADSRDRDTTSFIVGADLAATDRTGGRIRVGVSESQFDSDAVSDETTLITDISFYYRPVSFSRFDFIFNRDFETVDEDTNGVGESVIDDIRFTWSHDWTGRFSTRLSLESDGIDRECPNIDTLTNSASLEFSVNIRRWISVGAGAGTERRTADACAEAGDLSDFEYDRTRFGVHLRATL